MKNSKIALAALGVAAIVSAPAFAADVVYQEPAAPAPIFTPTPVATWEGAYAGLHVGYGFSGKVRETSTGAHLNTKGWLGGAFAGYNFQNGQFVYGLEGDVSYNGNEGSDGAVSTRARVDGSIRARLGAAVTDDILVYATAGGAAEQRRVSIPTGHDTKGLFGYTVGAGVDAKLTDQVFARAEYRYSDFGKKTFDLPGVGATQLESNNHRVTLGLGVKF